MPCATACPAMGIGSPGRRPRASPRDIREKSPKSLSESVQRESTPGNPLAPASGREQKLVAVLAIDLTLPTTTDLGPPQDEPWTVLTRWKHIVAEKVREFDGVV